MFNRNLIASALLALVVFLALGTTTAKAQIDIVTAETATPTTNLTRVLAAGHWGEGQQVLAYPFQGYDAQKIATSNFGSLFGFPQNAKVTKLESSVVQYERGGRYFKRVTLKIERMDGNTSADEVGGFPNLAGLVWVFTVVLDPLNGWLPYCDEATDKFQFDRMDISYRLAGENFGRRLVISARDGKATVDGKVQPDDDIIIVPGLLTEIRLHSFKANGWRITANAIHIFNAGKSPLNQTTANWAIGQFLFSAPCPTCYDLHFQGAGLSATTPGLAELWLSSKMNSKGQSAYYLILPNGAAVEGLATWLGGFPLNQWDGFWQDDANRVQIRVNGNGRLGGVIYDGIWIMLDAPLCAATQ